MSGSSDGYCPICGKSYGPKADRCPVHGFLFQSRDALRPGTVIDGAYEILQRLGAGGMGETYLVRHAFLGEDLVLKRIRPELAEDPLYQHSFLREAHSLAALRKLPAVVEIRNAWQTREGYLALLLEYVEGGNLLQWLETTHGGGPLTPETLPLQGDRAACGVTLPASISRRGRRTPNQKYTPKSFCRISATVPRRRAMPSS